VNESGQVVGYFTNGAGQRQAFLHDPIGGIRELSLGGEFGEAIDVNDAGQVVGYSMDGDGQCHNFFYDPVRGIQAIILEPTTVAGCSSQLSLTESGSVIIYAGFPLSDGKPPSTLPSPVGREPYVFIPDTGLVKLSLGGRYGEILAYSESGYVLGWAEDRSQMLHAFLYHPDMGIRSLPVEDVYVCIFGGPPYTSCIENVWGVTEDGIAIGMAPRVPFIYNQDNQFKALSLGGSWGYACALNSKGQVVGQSANETGMGQAFLHDPAAGIRPLSLGGPQGNAYGINEQGQAIGWSQNGAGDVQAFVYEQPAGVRPLSLGGRFGYATAINEAGQVIGESENEAGERHAFLYDPETGMQTLTLGGASGHAYDINEAGQVVGWSEDALGATRAFLYDPNDGIQPLSLGGSWGFGYRITASGQVIGRSQNASGDTQAFVFDPVTGILELSLGGSWSDATDINHAGQVVGYGQTANGQTHAFLYDPTHGLIDLNDAVKDPKGFVIQIARFINEKGEILAEGSNTAQNKLQPLLLQLETP
jgi:probable HAF family extracellular repeat protein